MRSRHLIRKSSTDEKRVYREQSANPDRDHLPYADIGVLKASFHAGRSSLSRGHSRQVCSHLSTCLRAEFGGSHTYEAAKNLREIALIPEPSSHTGLEHGHLRCVQQLFGACDSSLKHVPVWAESRTLLKESGEVVEIHSYNIRKDQKR